MTLEFKALLNTLRRNQNRNLPLLKLPLELLSSFSLYWSLLQSSLLVPSSLCGNVGRITGKLCRYSVDVVKHRIQGNSQKKSEVICYMHIRYHDQFFVGGHKI